MSNAQKANTLFTDGLRRGLRRWLGGTAYRDGTATRYKKGWYISEDEFKKRQAQGWE